MKSSTYLHHVHAFRGFAILNIVAIHAAALAQFIPSGGSIDTTSLFSSLNETLFHDATLYFALISGLLYSAVLKPRGLSAFFRGKLLNVVAPYAFWTLVFSVVILQLDGSGVLGLRESIGAYLDVLPKNLLHGEAQFTFWYIPILLLLFAATPLLSAWVERGGAWNLLLWAIMLAPLIVSRSAWVSGGSQITVATFFYFLGAYTVGIYLGSTRDGGLDQRLDSLSKYWKVLLAVALVASIALLALYRNDVDRIGFYSFHETLFYVQKISVAVLVLIASRTLDPRRLKWLSPFADAAFSIYFLHVFFMLLIADLAFTFVADESLQPASIYLMTAVHFFAALALSALTIFLFRKAFGQPSRMLIGS